MLDYQVGKDVLRATYLYIFRSVSQTVQVLLNLLSELAILIVTSEYSRIKHSSFNLKICVR